ncbi:MAG TPA: M56 family metallopeptidase [Verrucomicrobiae bacterium]|nr:M56 family metallopeptidase [Verrucomicrobiae bacterium]
MNAAFGVVGELVLSIAAGLGALALAAAFGQRWLASTAWRRMLWEASLLAMMLFAILELAGARGSWTRWSAVRTQGPPANGATASFRSDHSPVPAWRREMLNSDLRRGPGLDQDSLPEKAAKVAPVMPVMLAPKNGAAVNAIPSAERSGISGRLTRQMEVWIARAWVVGSVLVLGWIGLGHGLFRRVRRGAVPIRDPNLLARVEWARVKLGLPATLRVLVSPRFQGPIAFGILRPGIGLPCGFGTEPETRQDVMLLHELAHVEARDPAWQLCADVAAALVWWHPAIWWARRGLQFANEIAADETSLWVADGPGALAECLVEQGLRLRGQSTARLGIGGSGFRSGLARRVERLTRLRGLPRCRPRAWTVRLANAFGLAIVLSALLCGASWAFPQLPTQGTTMKPSTLPVFALAALLAEAPGSAAEPRQPGVAPVPPPPPPGLAIPVAPPPPPLVAPPALPSAPAGQPPLGTVPEPASPAVPGVPAPPEVEFAPAQPGPSPNSLAHPRPGGMMFGGGHRGGGGFMSYAGDGARALRQKLEQIVLPEVSFDAIPLAQVVDHLRQESIRLDPAKVGVNFLFGHRRQGGGAPIDPTTGLPVVKPPEDESLLQQPVRIVPTLKRVRLVDVLDAITRVTPDPVYYVVEEYAVVFTFDPPSPPQPPFAVAEAPPGSGPGPVGPGLKLRAFKLKKATVVNSMEVAFGISMDNTADLAQILRDKLFPKVGVHLDKPDRAMFFNELTSTLLVRASEDELAGVAATIEMLTGAPSTIPPPQRGPQ